MTTAATRNDQSQWALIWQQFRKRRLAVACAITIVMLVTVSIFAPFLANDRPLTYYGVNRFEFREALRTTREILSRLSELPHNNESAATRRDLTNALALQGHLMTSALPAETAQPLEQLIDSCLAAASRSDGSAELKEVRRTLQSTVGGRDIALRSRRFWPVVASLTWLEVFFMVWNVVLLAFPLWMWLLRRIISEDKPRRRRRVAALIGLGIPVLAALAWWWAVPVRIDRTNYKAGVVAAAENAAAAPVVYESVVWPAIPYAIDEDDLSQKEIRPAWFDKTKEPVAAANPWAAPHWLGTDSLGRDILCRMVWGGRISLSVGIVAVSIYVTIGIIIGAIAGYFRGIPDLVISRIIEVVICFPAFFLILTIVAFVGPSIFNIMVVIGLTGWTGIARLIRGEFLRLVDQEFVLAGRALGFSPQRLIFRHVLPNAMAPVLVSATFGVAGAILTESALSFLGLGISAPTPSWGGMLTSGRDAIFRAPWLIWYPGLAIFVTISCYNLVGEALRDASDPRLRGSR